MKTLLICLGLLSICLAQGGIETCDCGIGYMDTSTKKCKPNPTSSETGYIADCAIYEMDGEDLECDLCKSGYSRSINKQSCRKVTSTISGCKEYYQDGSNDYCEECEDGKYTASNSQSCLTPSPMIQNCKEYRNNACDECNENYTKQTDGEACHATPTSGANHISGCVVYTATNASTFACQYCYQKELNQGTGQCDNPSTSVANCGVYFSGSCVFCIPGNYVDSGTCKTCPAAIQNSSGGDSGDGESGSGSSEAGLLKVSLAIVACLSLFFA